MVFQEAKGKVEYRALTYTTTEVAWLKTLFTEVGLDFSAPPIIWSDNESASVLTSNPVFHVRRESLNIFLLSTVLVLLCYDFFSDVINVLVSSF